MPEIFGHYLAGVIASAVDIAHVDESSTRTGIAEATMELILADVQRLPDVVKVAAAMTRS